MSGRILAFTGSEHHEVARVLPWLVNGTLDAPGREAAMRHLEGCAQCRADADGLRAVQQVCRSAGAEVARPSFERIRAKLQEERRPAPAAGASGWRRLWHGWLATPTWMRGLAAAQCVLLVVLGVVAVAPAPDAYRVLADQAPAQPVGEARLVAVFEPGLSQARLQQLLRASGARIVNGPNDVGAYVLAVPQPDLLAARDALRAAPGVVMVEELGGVPR